MVENNTYEENVKDFNRMFNDLNNKDFNWDTHAMIDNVVRKIEAEYTMNYIIDNFNAIHINRFQDVLKWESFQKFMHPGGSGIIPPIGYNFVTPKGPSFFVDRSGRRRRKKYL